MMKKIFSVILILFGCLMFVLPVKAAQMTVSTEPHWENGSISVYIPPKEAKTETMKHAFQKWERLSYGKLNFRFVDKQPAQITVVFTDKVNGNDGPLGICNLSIQGPYITKAEIRIAVKGKQSYSNDMIYTTMLHEIGHALGLNHNTRKYRSIMHFPITEDLDILSIDTEKLFRINHWSWGQRKINK